MHSNLFTLSLLPAVLAYGGSYGGSDSVSVKPAAAVNGVHIVKVGDGGLVFDPPEVKAAVGEVVEFHFWPKAHSVAQSSFDAPCQPLNTTGFFSGPVKIDSGESEDVFRVTIKDEKPLWYYCATGQHCQNGMVGVINAPANGRTLEQYKASAAEAEKNVAPSKTGGGELGKKSSSTPAPSESNVPGAGVQTHGSIRWGLLSVGIAMAGFVGGMAL